MRTDEILKTISSTPRIEKDLHANENFKRKLDNIVQDLEGIIEKN